MNIKMIKAECKTKGLVYDKDTKKCRPSKRIMKTVAVIKAECKTKGLVYDKDTKKCRPSKRIMKTVAVIKAECKAKGLVYDKDTKKCRPSKLNKTKLSKTKLSKTKLSKTKLSKTKLSKTKLSKTKLSKTKLSKTKLSKNIVELSPIVPVGPGIPIEFNPIVEDCRINKTWNKGALLGQGLYGSTYIACHINNPTKCNYVLKVQKDTMEFHTEVRALVDLKNTGVVVKIYAAWICQGEGFIIMEKVFECKKPQIGMKKYKNIERSLEIIRENDWLHTDVHAGNFMCRADGSIVIIDFGYGVKKGKDNYPDHPFSKQIQDAYTFNELKIVQDWLAIEEFGKKRYPNYIPYKKKYDDLMYIIYKRRIKK
jgi:hypothetical protein